MKAEHTMTPAEEAEWVQMMQEGRLPPGRWYRFSFTERQRKRWERARDLTCSRHGIAVKLGGLAVFLEWFGL